MADERKVFEVAVLVTVRSASAEGAHGAVLNAIEAGKGSVVHHGQEILGASVNAVFEVPDDE